MMVTARKSPKKRAAVALGAADIGATVRDAERVLGDQLAEMSKAFDLNLPPDRQRRLKLASDADKLTAAARGIEADPMVSVIDDQQTVPAILSALDKKEEADLANARRRAAQSKNAKNKAIARAEFDALTGRARNKSIYANRNWERFGVKNLKTISDSWLKGL